MRPLYWPAPASRSTLENMDFDALAQSIKTWGRELGFQKVGIAGIHLPQDEQRLAAWLAQGRHGTMAYMARHGTRRTRPDELVPGTLRVVSARMDYQGTGDGNCPTVLAAAFFQRLSRANPQQSLKRGFPRRNFP